MEKLDEISASILLLNEQMKHYMEVNELQHSVVLEKLAALDTRVSHKHIVCDQKFTKLEEGYDGLKEWRIYTVALISFIGLIVPYVLPKIFP